jgi:hypothetical protein
MDSDAKLREIVTWASQVPEGADTVLEKLRGDEEMLRQQQAQVQATLTEVMRQIAMIEDALELRRWVEAEPDTNPPRTPKTGRNGRRPSRGREAVMYLMNDHPPEREWTIREVVRELAALDLAKPDDEHAVSVSLSRLFRAGKVYRPRKGVYTLTAPDYEDAPDESSKATASNRLFTGNAGGEAASEGT